MNISPAAITKNGQHFPRLIINGTPHELDLPFNSFAEACDYAAVRIETIQNVVRLELVGCGWK